MPSRGLHNSVTAVYFAKQVSADSAHWPAWVSNEFELRAAVANPTISTICVNASFALSGGEVLVNRSANVTGFCNATRGSVGCTLTVNNGDPSTSVLRFEATGLDPIAVHVEGINFVAADTTKGTRSKSALECSGARGSVVNLKNSLFYYFQVSRGALSISGVGCAVTCTNCGFSNNEAILDGGAAYVRFGFFACHDCSFANNRANRGGAIFVATGGHAELQYPLFSENVAAIGGPDVFIEEAPFAGLTYCPPSTIPSAAGSQRLPVASQACTAMDASPPDGDQSSTIPRDTVSILGLPGTHAGSLMDNFTHGIPPASSDLLLYTLSGVSQVFAGHSFGVRALLTLPAQLVDDVVLDLSIGQREGPGDSCSGFLLDAVTPVQGFCNVLSSSDGQAGGCSATCRLGRVQWGSPVFLDLTLRALAVGCQLDLVATISSLGYGAMPLPVQVMQASGALSEPIHALDARQPVIAPTSGAVGSLRQLVGHEGAAAFVGASDLLSFSVIAPGLSRCNLNNSILVDGPGQVVNVTMGQEGGLLLSFQVAITPESALSLQVAPSACVDADGHASMASGPFPILIDHTRPSVTVTGVNGKRTDQRYAVFRIQFSEWVSGFSHEGIDIIGGYLACLTPLNETDSTYQVVIKAMEGSQALAISVREGAAVDIAGNPSTASSMEQYHKYHRRLKLTKTFSGFMLFVLGVSLVLTLMKNGPSQGRLVAFVWHLQFFQMISFLGIPLDNTLGDILHELSWVNNGWPLHPIFGEAGALSHRFFENGVPDLFFPSNGSCRMDAPEIDIPDLEGMARRRLQEATDGAWPRASLTELTMIMNDAHRHVPLPDVLAVDDLLHLNTQGDFWAIVLYSLCELLACVVVRLLCTVLWRLMYHFRPGPFWKAAPAILLFPRLELLVLMLTFPTMTQACMFYATSGFKWGLLTGACVGVGYPVAFILFVFYFILVKILVNKECSFRKERIYLKTAPGGTARPARGSLSESDRTDVGSNYGGPGSQDSLGIPANHREPLLLEAAWVGRSANSGRVYVLQYGLLFEDLKGPKGANVGRGRGSDRTGRKGVLSRTTGSLRRTLSMDLWMMRRHSVLREWTPEPSQRGPLLKRTLSCLSWPSRRITRGHLAPPYMLVMILKQFFFAALTGISYRHLDLPRLGSFQVGFMLVWLIFHVVYLILVQPHVRRQNQTAEVLAMLCELGSLACCLALVIMDEDTKKGLVGTFSSIILLFLMLSMIASVTQLWWNVPQIARDLYRAAREKLPGRLQGGAQNAGKVPPLPTHSLPGRRHHVRGPNPPKEGEGTTPKGGQASPWASRRGRRASRKVSSRRSSKGHAQEQPIPSEQLPKASMLRWRLSGEMSPKWRSGGGGKGTKLDRNTPARNSNGQTIVENPVASPGPDTCLLGYGRSPDRQARVSLGSDRLQRLAATTPEFSSIPGLAPESSHHVGDCHRGSQSAIGSSGTQLDRAFASGRGRGEQETSKEWIRQLSISSQGSGTGYAVSAGKDNEDEEEVTSPDTSSAYDEGRTNPWNSPSGSRLRAGPFCRSLQRSFSWDVPSRGAWEDYQRRPAAPASPRIHMVGGVSDSSVSVDGESPMHRVQSPLAGGQGGECLLGPSLMASTDKGSGLSPSPSARGRGWWQWVAAALGVGGAPGMNAGDVGSMSVRREGEGGSGQRSLHWMLSSSDYENLMGAHERGRAGSPALDEEARPDPSSAEKSTQPPRYSNGDKHEGGQAVSIVVHGAQDLVCRQDADATPHVPPGSSAASSPHPQLGSAASCPWEGSSTAKAASGLHESASAMSPSASPSQGGPAGTEVVPARWQMPAAQPRAAASTHQGASLDMPSSRHGSAASAGTVTADSARAVTANTAGTVTADSAGAVTANNADRVTADRAGTVTANSAGEVTADSAGAVTPNSAGRVTADSAGAVTASSAGTAGADNIGAVISLAAMGLAGLPLVGGINPEASLPFTPSLAFPPSLPSSWRGSSATARELTAQGSAGGFALEEGPEGSVSAPDPLEARGSRRASSIELTVPSTRAPTPSPSGEFGGVAAQPQRRSNDACGVCKHCEIAAVVDLSSVAVTTRTSGDAPPVPSSPSLIIEGAAQSLTMICPCSSSQRVPIPPPVLVTSGHVMMADQEGMFDLVVSVGAGGRCDVSDTYS
eukprot:jgi/Mesvir1/25706/Mv01899-RA.1